MTFQGVHFTYIYAAVFLLLVYCNDIPSKKKKESRPYDLNVTMLE